MRSGTSYEGSPLGDAIYLGCLHGKGTLHKGPFERGLPHLRANETAIMDDVFTIPEYTHL